MRTTSPFSFISVYSILNCLKTHYLATLAPLFACAESRSDLFSSTTFRFVTSVYVCNSYQTHDYTSRLSLDVSKLILALKNENTGFADCLDPVILSTCIRLLVTHWHSVPLPLYFPCPSIYVLDLVYNIRTSEMG
jgi:hypothetical protein